MDKRHIEYTPEGGVCSKKMIVDAEDGIITGVEIVGGCAGNTQGVSRLLVGMAVPEAIKRIEGIDCHERGTSCPDQLSKALRELL